VEEEVRSSNCHILFHRDILESYTPWQTHKIMSEGIGTDGDVSMEGLTLLYKAIGEDLYKKYYTLIYQTARNKMHQQSDAT
jgi:hypothetical protein